MKQSLDGSWAPLLMMVRVLILILLLILLSMGSDWGIEQLKPLLIDWRLSWGRWALILALPVYIVLMSLPFVPGLEIGLALLMVFGESVAIPVYLGTLMALSLSFYAGRSIPLRSLIRAMHIFRLLKAETLMLELQGVEREHLIDVLTGQAPNRIVPFLVRHRFMTLVLLLNLPGNALIGGGGGIGLIAGLSRLFSYRQFLFAIALAVAPVPVLFYFGVIG
jgi:hypothetical protein